MTGPSALGLDLFSDRTPPAARRRYVLHALVYVAIMLALLWPAILPVNRVEPLMLGMPFVMFWIALSLLFVLVNTAALYRYEYRVVRGDGDG